MRTAYACAPLVVYLSLSPSLSSSYSSSDTFSVPLPVSLWRSCPWSCLLRWWWWWGGVGLLSCPPVSPLPFISPPLPLPLLPLPFYPWVCQSCCLWGFGSWQLGGIPPVGELTILSTILCACYYGVPLPPAWGGASFSLLCPVRLYLFAFSIPLCLAVGGL